MIDEGLLYAIIMQDQAHGGRFMPEILGIWQIHGIGQRIIMQSNHKNGVDVMIATVRTDSERMGLLCITNIMGRSMLRRVKFLAYT